MRHDIDCPALPTSLAALHPFFFHGAIIYLVPLLVRQRVQIGKCRHLGPSGIRNEDIKSAEILDGLLDDTDIIFPLLSVLPLAMLIFNKGSRGF
jgi:hypothetical protein